MRNPRWAAKGKRVRNEAQTALAQLSENALHTLILELGRYALSVSSRLYWRTQNAVELPGGETVDSVVSKALTKVLTGERRWDPHKAPDLKAYLMSVIDSLLNHLAEHRDNRVLTAMPETGSDEIRPAALPSDPETALLRKEQAEYDARVLQLLIEASEDDPMVVRMIRTMQDGVGKPGDIAAALRIDVIDVYNAMKRLDRKIMRVRRHLQETQNVARRGGHDNARA